MTGNREVGNSLQPSALPNQRDCRVVQLACRGKLPIHQLQKTTQFAALLLKSLNAEPQRRYDVLFGKTLAVWWGIDSGDRSARSRAGTHDTQTQFFLAIQPCRRYPRFGGNGSEVDFPIRGFHSLQSHQRPLHCALTAQSRALLETISISSHEFALAPEM